MERKVIGAMYTGTARGLEGASAYIDDHRLAHLQAHRSQESAAVEKAEEYLLHAARILRVVGNNMQQKEKR